MPPAGFETTVSAGERQQTCALDPVATGIGSLTLLQNQIVTQARYHHIINGILAKELHSQCIPQHADQFSAITAGVYVH